MLMSGILAGWKQSWTWWKRRAGLPLRAWTPHTCTSACGRHPLPGTPKTWTCTASITCTSENPNPGKVGLHLALGLLSFHVPREHLGIRQNADSGSAGLGWDWCVTFCSNFQAVRCCLSSGALPALGVAGVSGPGHLVPQYENRKGPELPRAMEALPLLSGFFFWTGLRHFLEADFQDWSHFFRW